jgi:hypothetical protein
MRREPSPALGADEYSQDLGGHAQNSNAAQGAWPALTALAKVAHFWGFCAPTPQTLASDDQNPCKAALSELHHVLVDRVGGQVEDVTGQLFAVDPDATL